MPKRVSSGPDTKSRVRRLSPWVRPEKRPKKDAKAATSAARSRVVARNAKSTKCLASTPQRARAKSWRR